MEAEKEAGLAEQVRLIQDEDPNLSHQEAVRLAEKRNSAGKVIMATVKGDVHDIGKNIVGVVLACNGFEVVDMGVMVPCDKILDTFEEQQGDIIGLSGLITPSLDEMITVAKEAEKRGFGKRGVPILIGGATTSSAHTAIKIAHHYSGPLVHVLDASRSVPVTTALLSEDQREQFVIDNNSKHEKARAAFAGGPKKEVITLAQAQENRFIPETPWEDYTPPQPEFIGTRTIANQSLRELITYIDWSPFFHAWELRGVWDRENKVLKTRKEGAPEEAAKLYAEANELLEEIIANKSFTARGIYGFFPAYADGDDIVLPDHDTTFHTLRQQTKKSTDKPHFALADYVKPKETQSTASDHLGGFVVGIHGAHELADKYEADNDPYRSIMVKAIADRLAEAFAELLHHRARIAWGIERPGQLNHTELIKEVYQGIRPAPGYPAQPDHTEKPLLFKLLNAESETGVELTESCAMHPGAAVCGLIFSHPDSHYFVISELQKDQVEDYAKRKGQTLEEAEKWLGPWLGY